MGEQVIKPHVFVMRGDLTDLRADVVIIPTSTAVGGSGAVIKAAKRRWGEEDLSAKIHAIPKPMPGPGSCVSFPINAERPHAPQGAVLVATVVDTVKPDEIRMAAKNAVDEARRLLTDHLRPATGGTENSRIKDHWIGSKSKGHRRALVAMSSLATGKGGGGEKAATFARAQVEGIVDSLEDSDDFDVVIVAWDHDAHARFLSEREKVTAWKGRTASSSALDDVGEAIRTDACVLFVGAGLSMGVGLPGWDALINAMEKELPRQSVQDLPKRSSTKRKLAIAERFGQLGPAPGHHYARIADTYGPEATKHVSPSLAHYLLLSLPIRYVVTTNYDGLVERTLERLRTPKLTVVEDKDVALSGAKHAVTVFKIHGHAGSGGAKQVVLTESEYKGFARQHPAKAALLQALLLNHHFLFVGYGLGDHNLNAVHNRVAGMLADSTRRAWVTSISETSTKGEQKAEARGVIAKRFGDTRELAIALDQLASTRVVATRTLFADQHEQPVANLQALHSALRHAGDAAFKLATTTRVPSELEIAYQALDDITALGWRPPTGNSRFEMWQRIAVAAGEGTALAVRAWRSALGDADTSEQAAHAAVQLGCARGTTSVGEDAVNIEGRSGSR